MYSKIKVTYPSGYEKFMCIGGNCEDTCCKGWDIEIDKDTFIEYSKVSDEKMKNLLSENIHRNDDCSSDDLDYGVIKLNKEKRCPFLDKCNYCSIYTNIGEEYLSNICTQFPRVLNKVDKEYEISLDVSCIEAARIMLKNNEKIRFSSNERVFNKYIINDEYNTNSKKYKKSPVKYLKEIRRISIDIMQNRNYDLSMRFYILGMFIKALEGKFEDDIKSVNSFINEYDVDEFVNYYDKTEDNYAFQIDFFKRVIMEYKIKEEAITDEFKKYTENILKVFTGDKEEYIYKFNEYIEEIIDKNSYIFENYIVNYMYNNLFPFSESDYMFEGYIMLLVRYAFIRFYLVGQYIIKGYEDIEDIIKLISLFARDIEHDKTYMNNISEYIEENEYDNLEFANKLL